MKPEGLSRRIVRVVIRFAGTSGDAARAIGCTKLNATRMARRMGLSFRDVTTYDRANERARQLLQEMGEL
jgi:hypothetical protein